MRRSALLLGVTAIAGLALVPASAGDRVSGSDSIACGDNGTISWTPTFVWPPNHKDVPATFTYTDPDGGQHTLTITAKPHSQVTDEGEELNGSGNTPYATDSVGGAGAGDGSATVNGSVRAERSGRDKAGRTYRFEYVADNNAGDDGCASSASNDADDLLIHVPHDCRGGVCKKK